MYTSTDEQGLLNNFATEPKMYRAEYPSPEQQKRYIAYGAASMVLVALTIFTAVAIS
ncbi:ssl1498 family light-harvesting-like protein [Phormidium pseudopriestleyi FRX01]|uniref:Ssl1498 family light-harvesting-like protein n=1 Tax=Phormidium pseudopriestleyi FRX01 TaxID=1759528 RepID=A0ABS3FP94_9CYAN|nr:ssl1498 family light-harvesting-like protein [Phormidium pseudopriestleyi]MBO0348905.1 ssl1498 family light-harvesting-like protein [Phormidium pseudopriestleyi FRX01]